MFSVNCIGVSCTGGCCQDDGIASSCTLNGVSDNTCDGMFLMGHSTGILLHVNIILTSHNILYQGDLMTRGCTCALAHFPFPLFVNVKLYVNIYIKSY